MPENNSISKHLVGRLSFYRRMLERIRLDPAAGEFVFSHELAAMTGIGPALVRRDIMAIHFSGNPRRGYHVAELAEAIGAFLDPPSPQRVGLAGLGNLGRALVAFFAKPASRAPIVAAFDIDPSLVGRTFSGCLCHHADALARVVRAEGIRVGVLAVPPAAAQDAADGFIEAGIRGILNFAPVFIEAPESVYVHNIDMTMSLEQVVYFARDEAGNGDAP